MKSLRSQYRFYMILLGILCLAVLISSPRAEAGTPCCGITSIDAKTGLVTVKETATGATFQFKVHSAKLLKSFEVGQTLDTKAIANAAKAGALGGIGGKPFCKCGKRADGTCWCVNEPGDLCYNPLCPSVPGVKVEGMGGGGK